MSSVTSRLSGQSYDADEWQLRVDLAAVFRLAVHFNWHEAVANHFSAAVSSDGRTFLLNPRWQHFSTIKASDLLLLNVDDGSVMDSENAPDPSAWNIHGRIHANVPHAKVLLHCHPVHCTALCTLKDPSLKPIDQNTASFFNRTAIDLNFGGLADDLEEGERISQTVGQYNAVLMGNHGVSVVGSTVAEAFNTLYYLERAAQTLILAYSTGQPLNIISDEIAEKTAQSWDSFKGSETRFFEQMKDMLDQQDPSYRE